MSRTLRNLLGIGLLLVAMPAVALAARAAQMVKLTDAVVEIAPSAGPVEQKAAQMLVEEAAKRSGVTLKIVTNGVASGTPVIRLSVVNGGPGPKAPESYALTVGRDHGVPLVIARGADPSGAMFAAGYLLREMRLTPGDIEAPEMDVVRAPAKPLRGHQMGWRTTPNTYLNWGVREYEQYIRDLIVWGTNAVELIPYDDPRVPPERSEEMNAKLSELIHSYGMKVWLWFPVDDRMPGVVVDEESAAKAIACPSRPEGRAYLLGRRRRLFHRLKYLDAVFIPGGDPAGCQCDLCAPWEHTFVPLCAEIADALHAEHPDATLWISNQGFSKAENHALYDFLATSRPKWLTGLVYSPWAEESCSASRAALPPQYALRMYPDISHEVRSQFTVPELDQAFACTLDREPPLYRPTETAHIVRFHQPLICGAVTYSEGATDDLNKMVWSAYLWDPEENLETVLHDYARCYFGERAADRVVAGIRGIERNGSGPLKTNASVGPTADLWNDLERSGPPELRKNWRFQMGLLRANYDLYVQRKLRADLETESAVYRALQPRTRASVNAAISVLNAAASRPFEPDLRTKLIDLGQALHDSIGMKLSVPRWGAAGSERGAIIDHLDAPLANQAWLNAQLSALAALPDDNRIANRIDRIVHWEDPGPGGFYDDLGDAQREPHLVQAHSWEQDPGGLTRPRNEFRVTSRTGRQTSNHYAETLYGTPIVMQYDGLDPAALYSVRATYSGRYKPVMTLTANGNIPIHGPVATPKEPVTWEWPIPRQATAGGRLTLNWNLVEGRGCEVSEVWLLKRPADAAP